MKKSQNPLKKVKKLPLKAVTRKFLAYKNILYLTRDIIPIKSKKNIGTVKLNVFFNKKSCFLMKNRDQNRFITRGTPKFEMF